MKLYVIAGMVVVILVFSGGAYFVGYKAGGTAGDKKMQDAVLSHRDKEAQINIKLEKSRLENRKLTSEKLKIRKEVVDSCLFTPIPPAIAELFND